MISRRKILRGLVTGTAAGLTAGLARPVRAAASAAAPSRDTLDPSKLFAPLNAGGSVGFGWSVESLSPPISGGLFLNLIHDSGATARVRVCRREGEGMGVAQSDLLDFVIMRRKRMQTEETLGRAVLAIAAAARKNEQRCGAIVDSLKTHKEHLGACQV